jgi:MFS family permease
MPVSMTTNIAGALTSRLSGIFYGWRVVAISFLANSLSTGTYYLGFSVFFLPISRDLDLSRTEASVPFSLARIIGAITGPIVGMWIDRVGPGKLLAASAFLGGLGFILLWTAHSYALFLLIFLGVITLGIQGGFDSSTSAAVTQWFIRRRGLALAVSQAGYSIGGGVIPPILALGVAAFDWRLTAVMVGFVMWAVVLPLSTQLRRSPESMGLRPDGLPPSSSGQPVASTGAARAFVSEGVPPKEAFRSLAYWMLALSFGFRATVWGAMAVHLVAIMVWKGVEESTAGYLVGVYSFAWMPAVLVMGWMGDRWSKRHIAAIGSFIGALGILLFLLSGQGQAWQVALALILLAPNEACWTLGWAMLGDFFGRRHFATLRGGMIGVMSLMSIGSPLYAGWVYDKTAGYFWVLAPAVAFVALAGALLLIIPKPRASGSLASVK